MSASGPREVAGFMPAWFTPVGSRPPLARIILESGREVGIYPLCERAASVECRSFQRGYFGLRRGCFDPSGYGGECLVIKRPTGVQGGPGVEGDSPGATEAALETRGRGRL